MIRSENMSKVSIVGLDAHRYTIIQELHKAGVVQIEHVDEHLDDFQKITTSQDLLALSDLSARVSKIKALNDSVSVKTAFIQSVLGLEFLHKKPVLDGGTANLIKEVNKFLRSFESKFTKIEAQMADDKVLLEKLSGYENNLGTIGSLNIPFHLLTTTDKISIKIGLIDGDEVPIVKESCIEACDDCVEFMGKEYDKKLHIVTVACLKEHEHHVDSVLKKHHFQELRIPEEISAKLAKNKKFDPMTWIKNEAKAAEKRQKQVAKDLAKLRAQTHATVVVLHEQLEVEDERQKIMTRFFKSAKTFVLQGWVRTKELSYLRKRLDKVTNGHYHVEEMELEITEDYQPPVQPTNPGWLRPFEMLTELYALPKYKDLDPTFVVGPLFVIYAGFMLTDFIYGLGLVILASFMLIALCKYDKSIKSVAINIFWMGVVAMVFGVLTGSYLGDAPKYFIGKETSELAIWNDPLADPLYFLILSMAVAVVHLNIGLLLGFVEDIRKGNWKDLISERVVWWFLQAGIASLYLGYMPMVGKILLGLTLLIKIVFDGPIGILGITGFLGDIISYSRLFALALSTAGIAMTVNLLANLVMGTPYIGPVAAVVIFIIGHLFSFLMNSLGSFVHSIRLQFVEFFGKFYEGGGDRFTPFGEKRVYTKVKASAASSARRGGSNA